MEFKQKIVTAGGKKRDYSRLINAIWMPLQEDYKEIIEADSSSPKEEREKQIRTYQNQIGAILLVNQSLKTIIDGIAWRYLNYNRAILSVLSNKEDSGPVRLDDGLITELFAFSIEILHGKKRAIINDISNFLRTGDITTIDDNGDI